VKWYNTFALPCTASVIWKNELFQKCTAWKTASLHLSEVMNKRRYAIDEFVIDHLNLTRDRWAAPATSWSASGRFEHHRLQKLLQHVDLQVAAVEAGNRPIAWRRSWTGQLRQPVEILWISFMILSDSFFDFTHLHWPIKVEWKQELQN
jgi:hypothetical protein